VALGLRGAEEEDRPFFIHDCGNPEAFIPLSALPFNDDLENSDPMHHLPASGGLCGDQAGRGGGALLRGSFSP
jgi:hypothetical protein